MRKAIPFLPVLLSLAALFPCRAGGLSYLDNGTLRVGVDLDRGGTIGYLASPPTGENFINTADLGRQVQQSYYSGPQPYGRPHPSWPNWPWNPIGTGDVYGNPSRILVHKNDGKLRVRRVALHGIRTFPRRKADQLQVVRTWRRNSSGSPRANG